MDLQSIINDPKATLIDVREPYEYAMGNVKGSINIPLGTIPGKVAEINEMPRPIVLFCASGNRSGQATSFLQGNGLQDTYNGGSWVMVDAMKMQTS